MRRIQLHTFLVTLDLHYNIHLPCAAIPRTVNHPSHLHPLILAYRNPYCDIIEAYCDVCKVYWMLTNRFMFVQFVIFVVILDVALLSIYERL